MISASRRAVAAGFTAHATVFGVLAAFASLLRPLSSTANVGRTTAALIASLPLCVLLAFARVAGSYADVTGSRRAFAVGGATMAAALLVGAAGAEHPVLLVAVGLPLGFGAGGLFVPSLRLVESAVDTPARAKSIGVAATGTAFGSFVLPPATWWVADRWGVHWALAALALACAAGTALALWHERRVVAGDSRPPGDDANDEASYLRLRRLRAVALLSSAAFYIPVAHLAAAAQDAHASVPLALATVGAANACGRLIANRLRKRAQSLTLAASALGLSAAMLLLAFGEGSPGAILAVAVVYGIAAGLFVVELPTCALEADRRSPGRVIGSMYQPMCVGALGGPLLAGISFEAWGRYGVGLAVASAFSIAAAVLVVTGARLIAPTGEEDGALG